MLDWIKKLIPKTEDATTVDDYEVVVTIESAATSEKED